MKVAGGVLTALCVAAAHQGAFAHTTIRDQVVTEGTRADNAVRISHTCELPGGEKRPVIAQSVVFPTDNPQLIASDATVTVNGLADVIEGGKLAGSVHPIQDRSIFFQQEPIRTGTDDIGFRGVLGSLSPDLRGRVPFDFSAPKFLATSCAKKLVLEIAIADVCSARKPTIREGKVNLWIPDNGSAIAIEAKAQNVDGVGAPAALTVNRNLQTNPLPASCGEGYDVRVRPSPAQLDRDLQIPNFWRQQ